MQLYLHPFLVLSRIAIYGPESTGKTELATKLAAHFRAPLVAEYARERWDQQGALTLEDMLPVAQEQWRREEPPSRNVTYCVTRNAGGSSSATPRR